MNWPELHELLLSLRVCRVMCCLLCAGSDSQLHTSKINEQAWCNRRISQQVEDICLDWLQKWCAATTVIHSVSITSKPAELMLQETSPG